MSEHPNDTLRGTLYVYERPEERHLRHTFGYWYNVEFRMIRAQLVAEGKDPDEFQAVSKRRIENHHNDETLRERQSWLRMREDADREHAWREGISQRSIGLTRVELEFLAEHFEGANSPEAAAIHAKVVAAINRTESP